MKKAAARREKAGPMLRGVDGEGADDEWGSSGEDAADVVAEAHGGGANFAGVD